ncbi:MAG: hypothetical protein KDK70_27530 [Myxococcales bacterium]|nr:hypothetical protein [Myxococcales bacterium]
MSHNRRITVSVLALATMLAVACDKGEEKKDAKPEPKKTEAKADDVKAGDTKADDTKADTKVDDTKVDDTKADGGEAAADDGEAAADGGEAAADGGETAAATPATPAEPGKPGPAYFAVRDKGLVMLDGGTFTKVDGGPDKLVREISQGPDGGVYLLGFEGIMKLEGAKATLLAETGIGESTGSLEDFAVTKDGHIWAVGYKGVSYWDGSAWKTEEKNVLGDDVTLIRGVAVDGQGRVWVSSANKLHLREGEAWVDVDISKAFKRKAFFENVATGPEGVAYAVASDTLVKLTAPDALEKVKVGKKFAMLGELGFSATGVGALKTSIDLVTRVMPDGGKVNYKSGKDFAADRIEDVTPDDSGRVWIATDAGVAIVGPADERVEWRSGSVDELAGQVEVIGVVGSGPELPGEVGPVKTGGLKGKILQGGSGFAGAEVEICPKPSSFFKKSPCAESPTRRAATTDTEGNFQIDDVPLGAYGLAVKVGKKWQLTFGSEYGADMKEGEVYDIGSVKLNDDK